MFNLGWAILERHLISNLMEPQTHFKHELKLNLVGLGLSQFEKKL